MEPQIIDHYNDLPQFAKVIDKMNEEFTELQSENEELKRELEKYKIMIPYIPDFNIKIITKRQVNDYLELFDEIKENINEHLYTYKKAGAIADEEYDLKDLCVNSHELIEILFDGLNENGSNLNISREWCEYRIKNSLDKFKSVLSLQGY